MSPCKASSYGQAEIMRENAETCVVWTRERVGEEETESVSGLYVDKHDEQSFRRTTMEEQPCRLGCVSLCPYEAVCLRV